MLGRVNTKRLKRGQNHENGGPPMPHGERQMHEQFIANGLGGVILLDDVIDLGDRGGDEKGKDESGDVMVVGLYGDEDSIDDGEEREPPGDSVDHDRLRVSRGELVYDGAEEEEVDDGPSEEGPTGWGEVRLLDITVEGLGGSDGVDVRPQEEEIHDDIDDLEKTWQKPCSLVDEREERVEGSRWLNGSEASGSGHLVVPRAIDLIPWDARDVTQRAPNDRMQDASVKLGVQGSARQHLAEAPAGVTFWLSRSRL